MKLLRIKDNSQQKKDAFSQVTKLTGKIADKTLEQLEREGVFVFPETVKDAEDITQDQMILQSVNDNEHDTKIYSAKLYNLEIKFTVNLNVVTVIAVNCISGELSC